MDYIALIISCLAIFFPIFILVEIFKLNLCKKKNSEKEENQLYYLGLIIKSLKLCQTKDIQKHSSNEHTSNKENKIEINILDNSFYKNVYTDLLLYDINFSEKSKEEKYFIKNIVEILNIIYIESPNLFINSEFLRTIIMIVLNYIKSPFKLNIEFIAMIFNSFLQIIRKSKNRIIDTEIKDFEKNIIKTINTCIKKCLMNYDTKINKFEELKEDMNFNDLIEYIDYLTINNSIQIPLYLQGFVNYSQQNKQKKYIAIKIYNFCKMKNSFENMNYCLFQGYSLYSIIANTSEFDISIKEFNQLKTDRVTNDNAIKILKLSISLLKSNNKEDFLKEFEKYKENYSNFKKPNISKTFDNNEKYYKDLFDQLLYSLNLHKISEKSCIPLKDNKIRVLWLSFIEILLLNLTEEQIYDNKIKILFYFIVNIFSPNLTFNALEYREDTIPVLFMQSIDSTNLYKFQQIFKLLDLNYKDYYLDFEEGNKFEEYLNGESIKNIRKSSEFQKFLLNNSYLEPEINNLKLLTKSIILSPLLNDYLKKCKFIISEKNYLQDHSLKYLFKKSFSYLNDENDKKDIVQTYISSIDNYNIGNKSYETEINEIIKDKNYIILINEIMKSKVMKTAYYNINDFYISNGKKDLYEEFSVNYDDDKKEIKQYENGDNNDNKDNKKKALNNQNNLIGGKDLKYYYNSFCKLLETFDYSQIFIVMALPKTIKAFTFRFLKIILNYNGIKLNRTEKYDAKELLKAYLIFIIIHEQNHFIKRYFNENLAYDECCTPKINVLDEEEGSKQLIKLLFGDPLINNFINVEQAKYILEIDNWRKKTLKDFKNDFEKITKNNDNSSTILYLSSSNNSYICDHSKLSV